MYNPTTFNRRSDRLRDLYWSNPTYGMLAGLFVLTVTIGTAMALTAEAALAFRAV